MKRVLSNNITTTAKQPFIKRTFAHYQENAEETLNSLAKAICGSTNDFFILYGCENTGTLPAVNISAGAIYYNGEIYQVPAFSTVSLVNTVIAKITTTYATEDPVLFTDGSTHYVHQIKTIVLSDGVSGSGDVDFANIKYPNTYIDIPLTGITFQYIDNGGTTRTISSAPSINTFKYRYDGSSCHLLIDIYGIDTVTSNSGVGYMAILFNNMPNYLKPLFSVYSVATAKSSLSHEFDDFLQVKFSGSTLAFYAAKNIPTSTSAGNTQIRANLSYPVR